MFISYRDITLSGTFNAQGKHYWGDYNNPPAPGDVVTIYQEDADGKRSEDLVMTVVRTLPDVNEVAQEWISLQFRNRLVSDYSVHSVVVTAGDTTITTPMTANGWMLVRFDRVPVGSSVYVTVVYSDGVQDVTMETTVDVGVSLAEFGIAPSRIYASNENPRLITRDANMGMGDGVINLEPALSHNHPDFELFQYATWSMEPSPIATMNEYGEIEFEPGATGIVNVTVALSDGRTASAPLDVRADYININNYVPVSITSLFIKPFTYSDVYGNKYGGGMNLDTYDHEFGEFTEGGLQFDITPENADRAFVWTLGGISEDVVVVDTWMPNAMLYVQGDYSYDPATSPPKEPIVGTLTGRALNGNASHTVEVTFDNGDIIIGDTTEPLPPLA